MLDEEDLDVTDPVTEEGNVGGKDGLATEADVVDEDGETVRVEKVDHGDDDGKDLATGAVAQTFHIETEAVKGINVHGG